VSSDLSFVLEVTDDKSLPEAERKRQQIWHVAHTSEKAKLVKLADKIANLWDLVTSPPVSWDRQRRLRMGERSGRSDEGSPSRDGIDLRSMV
jgi:hypothetical protein